jgi:DNA-binding response OmpR family regulator
MSRRERGATDPETAVVEEMSLGRTRTLDSHASRVRRKIATLTETPYVINEWGVGYRLMLP